MSASPPLGVYSENDELDAVVAVKVGVGRRSEGRDTPHRLALGGTVDGDPAAMSLGRRHGDGVLPRAFHVGDIGWSRKTEDFSGRAPAAVLHRGEVFGIDE